MSTALVERGIPDETTAHDGDSARIWSLVDRAAAGDRRAFATLYEIHVSDVFRYVLARTGNHHRAEDITSETFVRALSKMTSLTHRRSSFRAWLITIARNIVFDESRCARNRLEAEFPEGYEVVAADA
ncbi:sigma factor, partial [Haloechinothrix salitolerans]